MGDGTQYVSCGQCVVKICSDKRNTVLNDFIARVIHSLFGVSPNRNSSNTSNVLYLRVHSRFVFEYVQRFARYKRHKTSTVELRKGSVYHSTEFLKGVLLGLFLSDGYIKKRAIFRSTSRKLAVDCKEILMFLGFTPKISVQKRDPPNWSDIYSVFLNQEQTQSLRSLLDLTLLQLEENVTIRQLKYGR